MTWYLTLAFTSFLSIAENPAAAYSPFSDDGSHMPALPLCFSAHRSFLAVLLVVALYQLEVFSLFAVPALTGCVPDDLRLILKIPRFPCDFFHSLSSPEFLVRFLGYVCISFLTWQFPQLYSRHSWKAVERASSKEVWAGRIFLKKRFSQAQKCSIGLSSGE